MEENKTEIMEKRVSRGVIRRRSQIQQPDEKTPPSPPVETAAAPAVIKPVGPEDLVAARPKKEAEKGKEVKGKLVLDPTQKEIAEKHIKKNLKIESSTTAKQVPLQLPVQAKPEPIIGEEKVYVKKEQPKKEERDKVLTFKDRIMGTIDLDKFKVAEKSGAVDGAKPKTLGADGEVIVDDEEGEKVKKEKAARVKKGVKDIGGDLDIEGQGRATNLGQLVRSSPADRVFKPSLGRAGKKKKIISKKNIKQTLLTEKKAAKRFVEVDQKITVGSLAQQLGVKSGEIIKHLMNLGVMATINQEIDKDTTVLVANEYQYEVRDVSFKEDDVLGTEVVGAENTGDRRSPVVTIMGHVDHGKTSLLDAIRSTNVTSTEAGGITQHIGAYTVTLPQGKITFLDTPGHEAFTTMRSRGAQVTDLVVLVVAADDGMMPQTEESIDHAKAAGVPIIVAVNKIDKEQADAERIKRQLSEKGLVPEEWGGDTIFNSVSAKQKVGIQELLESILLQAEVLELKAVTAARAQGAVLEAKLDRGRGPACTLLVQSGTLRVGDFIVAGCYSGKVRAMQDWVGKNLAEAGPSMAVEILGLEGVPEAGDKFNAVGSDQDAHLITEHRWDEKRRQEQAQTGAVTLEDMFARMKEGLVSEFNIILKTDVQGSLEAVRDAVLKIGNEEVKARIIHTGVGGINESDVRLAVASKAVIIGFNVRPETKAIHIAKEAKIEIKLYKIIYDLVNEVKLAMQGLLKPDIKENYLGRAEVRQAFEVSKLGWVAGCMVVDGVVTRQANIRFLRDNVVIHEGKVTSLKRFKDDARDVKQGFECGIGIEGYSDIKTGDIIEAFERIEIQKTL